MQEYAQLPCLHALQSLQYCRLAYPWGHLGGCAFLIARHSLQEAFLRPWKHTGLGGLSMLVAVVVVKKTEKRIWWGLSKTLQQKKPAIQWHQTRLPPLRPRLPPPRASG
jgi:hypothetical protein